MTSPSFSASLGLVFSSPAVIVVIGPVPLSQVPLPRAGRGQGWGFFLCAKSTPTLARLGPAARATLPSPQGEGSQRPIRLFRENPRGGVVERCVHVLGTGRD